MQWKCNAFDDLSNSGSCNNFDNLSDRTFVPNEIKYVHVKVFNDITRFNELKVLIKHILCGSKCRFDGKKI